MAFTNIGVGPGPKKRSMPPPPFGGGAEKKPALAIAIGVGKPKPGADAGGPPMPDDEASESPQEEGSEEYGKKLLDDMKQPLVAAGLQEHEANTTLASIFEAMAKCLRDQSSGGSSEGNDLEGPPGGDTGGMAGGAGGGY